VNQATPPQDIDLLKLYDERPANRVTGFSDFANLLDPDVLISSYLRLMDSAPRRHVRDRKYFVGHTGKPGSGSKSNRREEHLAIALWCESRNNRLLMVPGAGPLEFLDYQFPLKAKRGDKGVGKVDLFGVLGGTKSCVIELKIHSARAAMSDTPLRAFLEALAYCAIVEANAKDIAREAFDLFGYEFSPRRPVLMVMATNEYWSAFLNHQKAGDWWSSLRRLADQLKESFDLESHFLVLRDVEFSMGLDGERPRMLSDCSLMHLEDLVS
jgi:hypothetical protein